MLHIPEIKIVLSTTMKNLLILLLTLIAGCQPLNASQELEEKAIAKFC